MKQIFEKGNKIYINPRNLIFGVFLVLALLLTVGIIVGSEPTYVQGPYQDE